MSGYNVFSFPNPIYQPAYRIIASITNAYPAVVTTTIDHLYLTGLIVRLVIPPACGMQGAAGQTGTGPTTFTIDINTIFMDKFSIPNLPADINVGAQVVPIGEAAANLNSAVQNVRPGSQLPN